MRPTLVALVLAHGRHLASAQLMMYPECQPGDTFAKIIFKDSATLWDPSRAQRLQWQREGEGRSGVLEEGIPIKTEAGKMTCMRRVAMLVARSCT